MARYFETAKNTSTVYYRYFSTVVLKSLRDGPALVARPSHPTLMFPPDKHLFEWTCESCFLTTGGNSLLPPANMEGYCFVNKLYIVGSRQFFFSHTHTPRHTHTQNSFSLVKAERSLQANAQTIITLLQILKKWNHGKRVLLLKIWADLKVLKP